MYPQVDQLTVFAKVYARCQNSLYSCIIGGQRKRTLLLVAEVKKLVLYTRCMMNLSEKRSLDWLM